MSLPDKNTIKQIIDGDTKTLVEKAKELGEMFRRDKLSTSQIRNIFSSVKKMEMSGFNEKEILLLKPKLAYAAGRRGAEQGTRDLKDVLSIAIECVGNSAEKFENFCNFFEAILAYHRADGGK
jgi:CRISPR-associated protein, Csm2 family